MRILLIAFLLSASVYAQPTSEEPTTPTQWYGTVGGIVGATILAVSVLKRALANVRGLNQVPLWIYAICISAGLTYLSNQIWHALPGDLWQLISQSVMMAAAATGFYEWVRSDPNGGAGTSLLKPLADSTAAQDRK